MRFRSLFLLFGIFGTSAYAQMSVTGTIAASQVTSGTFNISLFPATGISATKLNGTDISTLTGLLKLTSGTPSNAAAADIGALFGCTAGTPILSYNGTTASCVSAGGTGTVTSFSAGNLSPLFTSSVATATSTPALTFTLSNAGAHAFFGNNTGSSAAPAFVQPAFTDISGTVAASQLPNPSSSTLGGVQSAAAVSHQWINSISTSGVPALSQPAFTDLSGTAASSQLPTPGVSALGGIKSSSAGTNQFATGVDTTGAVTYAQPSFSNLSGSITTGQVPTAVPVWTKYTIPYTSVQTASTTNAVTIVSLTARQISCGVVEKHTVAWAGTSISGLTVTVGDSAGTTTTYSPVAFNLLQTVSNTAFAANNVLGAASFAGGTMQANFTASGANLSALTAGSVDFDVCIVSLP